MSTLTAYSNSNDGYLDSAAIYDGADYFDDYAAARGGWGAGGITAYASSASFIVGQAGDSSSYWNCYEGFLSFDASAIGDSDTIDTATLNLKMMTNGTQANFTVEARLSTWTSTLDSNDWIQGANLSSATLLASKSTSGWTGGTAADLTSETAFKSNVSKTGNTLISLSSSLTRAGSNPNVTEYVYFYSADETGTTSDPKLTVTYTAGGTASTVPLNLLRTNYPSLMGGY